MTIGERIQAARKNAGLTQRQLGEKLGVSYQAVAQWENNLRNPKKETIKKIAIALNISRYELYPEEQQGQAIIDSFLEDFGYNPEPAMMKYRIRQCRIAAGVSIEDVAKYVGVTIDTISEYEKENAQVPFSHILKIANYLNIPVVDMLENFDGIDEISVREYTKLRRSIKDSIDRKLAKSNPFSIIGLLNHYDSLNDSGKKEAIKRIEELTEIPKYQATAEEGNE